MVQDRPVGLPEARRQSVRARGSVRVHSPEGFRQFLMGERGFQTPFVICTKLGHVVQECVLPDVPLLGEQEVSVEAFGFFPKRFPFRLCAERPGIGLSPALFQGV